jgi:hypothetical protein
MIKPLSCTVDDETFRCVASICGEDVAWELCYEDEETYLVVKTMVDTILGGFAPGGKEIPQKLA